MADIDLSQILLRSLPEGGAQVGQLTSAHCDFHRMALLWAAFGGLSHMVGEAGTGSRLGAQLAWGWPCFFFMGPLHGPACFLLVLWLVPSVKELRAGTSSAWPCHDAALEIM